MYEVRWRVLRERVEQIITAEWAHDEDCARLAMFYLALLDRHKVNPKGRCRWCRPRGRWWKWRARRCAVLSLASYYLMQPRGVVELHN